jgi:fucose permease
LRVPRQAQPVHAGGFDDDSLRRVHPTRFAGLAVLGLFALGVPDGMIGVAWPSIARDVGEPLGALGFVTAGLVGGSLLGNLMGGVSSVRWGPGRVLAVGGLALCAAGLVYAAASVLVVVVAAAVVNGLGGGILDAGVNRSVALSGRPRLMQFIHAGFGVGTAVGPVIVVAALAVGGWRAAYVGLAVFEGVVFLVFWYGRDTFDAPGGGGESGQSNRANRSTLYMLTGALFFLYVGVELVAGQWGYSVLRAEGLGRSGAGYAVAGYWAALTTGRVVSGFFAHRRAPLSLMWLGIIVAMVGATLFATERSGLALAGLVLLGLGLAPVFPALVSVTPTRLHTGEVGFGTLFAMGGLGAVCLSGLSGAVTQVGSVTNVPLVVLAALLLLAACNIAVVPASRRRS